MSSAKKGNSHPLQNIEHHTLATSTSPSKRKSKIYFNTSENMAQNYIFQKPLDLESYREHEECMNLENSSYIPPDAIHLDQEHSVIDNSELEHSNSEHSDNSELEHTDPEYSDEEDTFLNEHPLLQIILRLTKFESPIWQLVNSLKRDEFDSQQLDNQQLLESILSLLKSSMSAALKHGVKDFQNIWKERKKDSSVHRELGKVDTAQLLPDMTDTSSQTTFKISYQDFSSQFSPSLKNKSCQHYTKVWKEKTTSCNICPSIISVATQCEIYPKDISIPPLIPVAEMLGKSIQVSPITIDSSSQNTIETNEQSQQRTIQAANSKLDYLANINLPPKPVQCMNEVSLEESSANLPEAAHLDRQRNSSSMEQSKLNVNYSNLQRSIILNVPSSVTEEMLRSSLSNFSNSAIIIKSINSTFPDALNWIILLPPQDLSSCLSQGGFSLGLTLYKIRPHTSIARCRTCQGLGHTSHRCHRAVACVNCGNQHTGPCALPPRCTNCSNYNLFTSSSISTSHPASDPHCYSYRFQYNIKRARLSNMYGLSTSLHASFQPFNFSPQPQYSIFPAPSNHEQTSTPFSSSKPHVSMFSPMVQPFSPMVQPFSPMVQPFSPKVQPFSLNQSI